MALPEGGAKAVMACYNAWNGTHDGRESHPAQHSSSTSGASTSFPATAAPSSYWSVRATSIPIRKPRSSRASRPASISSSTSTQDEACARRIKDGSLTEADLDDRAAPQISQSTIQARPARSTGHGALLEDQRFAGTLEYRQRSRCLAARSRLSRLCCSRTTTIFCPWTRASSNPSLSSGRSPTRALGLVWRHASLRRHAARRASRTRSDRT